MLFNKLSLEERRNMMLYDKILKTLLFLSIPTLLVGVIQSSIPLLDGLFLNNLSGKYVASAVSYSQPIIFMMIAFAQGLGVAVSALVGKSYGKGDFKAVKEISLQIFVFSFFLGILLIPICIYGISIVVKNIDSEISKEVFTYVSLYSFSIPFIFIEIIYNSVRNSTGRPNLPFNRSVILLIFKIIFNIIFLYFLKMNLIGSVIASILTHFLISVIIFYEMFIKNDEIKLNLKEYKFIKSIIKESIFIAFPAILSQVLTYFGFFLINNEVQKFGATALNGQGIAANINSICFILPATIGITATNMISVNIGIKNKERVKKIISCSYIVSVIIAIANIILMIPSVEFFTKMFTREREVLIIANGALNIHTYSVIGFGIFSVCQGVYNALGKTKILVFMSILRVWLLRYLFILLTTKYLGVYAIFYGNLFSNTLAAILFYILVKKIKREEFFE